MPTSKHNHKDTARQFCDSVRKGPPEARRRSVQHKATGVRLILMTYILKGPRFTTSTMGRLVDDYYLSSRTRRKVQRARRQCELHVKAMEKASKIAQRPVDTKQEGVAAAKTPKPEKSPGDPGKPNTPHRRKYRSNKPFTYA